MVTEEEKVEVVQAFENAKVAYEVILKKVNRISEEIDLLDKAVVKPMKDKNRFFGLTLITGSLPLDMLELKMRLEFTIKHFDTYIKDFKEMKTTQ
jgi:hypothetical protein